MQADIHYPFLIHCFDIALDRVKILGIKRTFVYLVVCKIPRTEVNFLLGTSQIRRTVSRNSMKQHALQTIGQFEQIRIDFKNEYHNGNLSENDFKGQVFNRIDKVIIFLNLNLQNFHDNLNNKLKFDRILPTASEYDYKEVLRHYFIQTKASFIYGISSVIETFFRELHKVLFPNKNIDKKSLYEILNQIFNKLELEKNENWIAMMVLSNIRNTIHNNGIHISEDRTFIYHNYEIIFNYNLPQNVALYDILSLILYDFLKLFKVINNKI